MDRNYETTRTDNIGLTRTKHAQARMQQRGIKWDSIKLALEWGEEDYLGAGVYRSRIRHRDVRHARNEGVELGSLTGLCVVHSAVGALITVYNNQNRRVLPSQTTRTHTSRRWQNG